MKKKSAIIIVSVLLNLVLFSALAHFNKINSRAEGTAPPFFVIQHLNAAGYAQSDDREIALASTVK